LAKEPRKKLVDLLDYVEQVVRLDERVAFRLSEYRLPDGSNFAVHEGATRNLPGVHHDIREDEGSVWLEVERLARKEAPTPAFEIVDWTVLSADPAIRPVARTQRILTVTAGERDVALSQGEVRPEDIMEAPRRRGEPPDAPPLFDLTLRLEDRPEVTLAIEKWIVGTWAVWATEELPRRRTIALYQQLYKVFQLVEIGGSESPIEVVWGVGVVQWEKEGWVIDRPLLERGVDLELDDARGGRLRIRPTSAEAVYDLKPYEEFGCAGLPSLSDLIRREIRRAADDEGISPFIRESFEPILSSAASRLDPEGAYAPDSAPSEAHRKSASRLVVTDQWVLFARPRSQHVILQDINRLREAAENESKPIGGVAERLVTEPSRVKPGPLWSPHDGNVGGNTTSTGEVKSENTSYDEVFFPKPFNDDQIEIVRRLSREDGLVVQGPPGTGKTHTIANMICHAMATGQRVLVVSRGEAALSVLRDQLPEEVQPLAISVLSSERQGLRQIESAIREIQAVVDGTRPENRRSVIRRLQAEIDGLRQRINWIDHELDSIAAPHLSKVGPRGESPAELAQRVASERKVFEWFVDRPSRFAAETGLTDPDMNALAEARGRVADLIDHLGAPSVSPSDVPDADTVAGWHDDLVRAAELETAAAAGPARSIRITVDMDAKAMSVADTLQAVADTYSDAVEDAWLRPFRRGAIRGETDGWLGVLRQCLAEWTDLEKERAALLRRPVELPSGLLDDDHARQAISRAAAGQRLWPVMSLGRGSSKTLVDGIRLDGSRVKDDDILGWRHIGVCIANITRRNETITRWNAFAVETGAPKNSNPKATIELAREVFRAIDNLRSHAGVLDAIVSGAPGPESLIDRPDLALSLAEQIRAAAGAIRLAVARQEIARTAHLFQGGTDRTSSVIRQLFEEILGIPNVGSEKVRALWAGLLQRLEVLKSRGRDFETIAAMTALIEAAGAPSWAMRLRTEPPGQGVILAADWRSAWDHAAADTFLAKIDAREHLFALAGQREGADRQRQKLFGELVRERTFDELDRRLSPSIKSALVEFVRALARIGKGTGKAAGMHRRAARDAMARCYDAVPCWIMPTWRVAEQLPAELGVFDLVIIDEASQSDVTELPALLRGRKILVVGDDRQVSPTAPFVTQAKVAQLGHHYLGDLPFKALLEPGESLYDLMRAVFPNERLMLKEHFRCVEPIIQFSMQFYPEKMLPLRIPEAHERLDPPLVDIFIPHGTREKRRKINHAEADVIVDEIMAITKQSTMERRTIGVISLIGAEQAEYIRGRLSQSIGEELMQRHRILCGDSATFQGTERDIVFLSMVADPANKTALTMLRYEQRFNVATSRARDRLVLVRSVKREELREDDLKARLIAHFENPMPLNARLVGKQFDVCESKFERDMMQKLLDRGYRVQGQVGSLGFRIDMVVEGVDGRRLAIECDGDRFHGPAQWREDMRRQRVLERVGWRFWRCFASSFYLDTDQVMSDLVDTLSRLGIEPLGVADGSGPSQRYTEHRVVRPAENTDITRTVASVDGSNTTGSAKAAQGNEDIRIRDGIGIGDKVILLFADDQRRLSLRLTDSAADIEKGYLSIASALGRAVYGADEGDEIEFQLEDGRQRKVLIESAEKVTAYKNQVPLPKAPDVLDQARAGW
jgi:very-short-patch-repair endonuclease